MNNLSGVPWQHILLFNFWHCLKTVFAATLQLLYSRIHFCSVSIFSIFHWHLSLQRNVIRHWTPNWHSNYFPFRDLPGNCWVFLSEKRPEGQGQGLFMIVLQPLISRRLLALYQARGQNVNFKRAETFSWAHTYSTVHVTPALIILETCKDFFMSSLL